MYQRNTKFAATVASAILIACSGGCTDWDAQSDPSGTTPLMGPGATSAAPDQGGRAAAGIVDVDGWKPTSSDAPRSAPDVGTPSFDAGGSGDLGAAVADDTASGTDSGDMSDIGSSADANWTSDSGVSPDTSTWDVGTTSDTPTTPDATPVVSVDGVTADTGVSDSGSAALDVVTPDDSDAGLVADAGAVVDAGPIIDAGVADTIGVADGGSSEVTSGDTWPTWTPDWSGYADVTFPEGVDIYGGVITSCFNLYTYTITESCAFPDLSENCIDTAAKDGSYYSRYLFAPLQGCMKKFCVPKCKADKDPKCVDKCLSKRCATPFFACLSQGEKGTNDCPATFSCLTKYEDKLFSIANKCFANATAKAQVQLATFFACGADPQTEGCIDHIAACFGPPGKLGCLDVIQCADKNCTKGDEVCGFQCIGKGTSTAVAKLDKLWDCSLAKCSDCAGPNGCGDACTNKYCSVEQMTCITD